MSVYRIFIVMFIIKSYSSNKLNCDIMLKLDAILNPYVKCINANIYYVIHQHLY